MDVASLIHSEPTGEPCGTLKRRASSTFDDVGEGPSRKRTKEASDNITAAHEDNEQPRVDGQALADELEQELQCGCCSALVYRPVVVSPCQHFFCGSCIVLWVKNGGTNCPACRGMSVAVVPSRPLQRMADVLVRATPSKARTDSERMQADEIYKGGNLRLPAPRQASPEPSIPQSSLNVVHPCPHCSPGNQWGWSCPDPIVDPDADPDGAWPSDDGAPPGHAFCGNCESILALRAPTTTKCDFCQVSFCGIGIPGRCIARSLSGQHLHGLNDLGDLLQCGEVYDIFDGNSVEVDIMFDYLTSKGLSPLHIYREIIEIITHSPRQFAPLIESELFMDVHVVAAGVDPDPTAPRNRICRMCATEVLLWGLKEWWVQERSKGELPPHIMKRPDCPNGTVCSRQKDHAHAKEFNHVIGAAPAVASTAARAEGEASSSAQGREANIPPAPIPINAGDMRIPDHLAHIFAAGPIPGPSDEAAPEPPKDLPDAPATQPDRGSAIIESVASSSSFDIVEAML